VDAVHYPQSNYIDAQSLPRRVRLLTSVTRTVSSLLNASNWKEAKERQFKPQPIAGDHRQKLAALNNITSTDKKDSFANLPRILAVLL